MGRLVVSEFITVDGVVEDPGGEGFERGGWAFRFDRGSEGDRFKLEEVMAAEALLLGRVTYEGFARAWPERSDQVGFAEKMNSMPKYVASRTLREPRWSNSKVLEGDVTDAVRKLKHKVDSELLVNGSVALAQTLLEHDLVDELRLMVFPVVLGAGKRLFGQTNAEIRLRQVESRPAGETLIVIYRIASE
jgi:dihydrofolate reductase